MTWIVTHEQYGDRHIMAFSPRLPLVASIVLVWLGCPSVQEQTPPDDDASGDDDSVDDDDTTDPEWPGVGDPLDLQEDDSSECGGFDGPGERARSATADAYCDHEVIAWTYDAEHERLTLEDRRIYLNCCGIHSMTIGEVAPGHYAIEERDEPYPDGGRCGCMCVFDFAVNAYGVPEQSILVQIHRSIPDWSECGGQVWWGNLDLSEGSGEVQVDGEDLLCESNEVIEEECEAWQGSG